MKKITFMLIALLCAMVTFAAVPKKQFTPLQFVPEKAGVQMGLLNAKPAPEGLAKKALKASATRARAPKKAVAAADLESDYQWDFLTSKDYSTDLESLETTPGSARVVITAAIGTNPVWVASEQKYSNAEEVSEITIDDFTTGVFAAGSNTNNSPSYYDTGTAVRMYTGNTLTITSKKTIANIIITFSGTAAQMCLKADDGKYAFEDNVGTWTGEANEVVFTVPSKEEAGTSSNPQARIQQIEVTYLTDGGAEPVEVKETIIISGMFPEDLEASLESDEDGDYFVIEGGQLAGTTSQYGDYVIYGMFYYEGDEQNEAGWYYDDIYGFLEEDGTITIYPWLCRVLTTGQYAGYALTPYWVVGSTLTPAEPQALVEVPAGVEILPYVMTYDEGNKAINVAVNGNDVYFQGMSDYLPESWVKGTMNGNTVTFPAMQWVGYYIVGDSYAFYNGDAVFTYDAKADTYSAEGLIYGVLADSYYDGKYTNPVLKGVVEKAAMPANPEITSLKKDSQYGWYFTFNVPLNDTEGDPLVASKLSYMIYTDVEGEIAPLTFTPATHTRLTEDLTEIPFGFTESYDIYADQIYLNDLYSADWNNLGIQSIYYGGGETNATEVQWFHIKDYISDEQEAIDPEGKTYTFDDGTLEGWSSIDADGDGYGWNNTLESQLGAHNGSEGAVFSQSYDNSVGPLTPDNYLVSPKVKLGSTFSFFAVAQDADYPEEHFGVFVSTKSKSVADFEKVEEWTLSASRMKAPSKVQGRWYQYIVDLSKYQGEEGYVAIRHFDCTDNFYMLVDDITFGTPADPDPDPNSDVLVELPDGVEAESWTLEGVYGTSYGYEDQQIETEVAFDGNDIYVKGLAYYFEDSWVKGTIENGIATFPSGQFVGMDDEGSEYMIGVNVIEGDEEDEYVITDFQYAYDAEARTLTQMTPLILENSDTYVEIAPWGYWLYSYFYAGEPIVLEPVQAPEGLETEAYYFTASVSEESEEEEGVYEMVPYSNEVKVGFDGDDVYIQGLSEDYPEAWVKATKNQAGQYVIPANQYMGTNVIEFYSYVLKYPYYFAALDENLDMADVVLNFDAETNTFSTEQTLMLNGSRYIEYPYITFEEVTISKIVEMAGEPVNASITGFKLEDTSYPYVKFNIPTVDVEGNPMLTEKLFYTVWVEKDGKEQPYTVLASAYTYVEEDMTEIPYNYDDSYDIYKGGKTFYFNPVEEVAEFTNIGIQTIYYGGDECNKTHIIWMDGSVTTGIKDINTANNTAVYYDLQGRKVNAPQKGLFIKQTRQDNGTVKTVKMVRK